MLIELQQRVSHYQWRVIVKRERRRQKRQTKARERDKEFKEEQEALLSDPSYLEELEEYQRHEEFAQKLEEEEAARRKEEWQLRDAALHSKFLREKERERLQEEARQRQEELIKKEWEEKQAKEKEEEKKKKKEQEALLEAATKGLGKDDEPTHNPEPPANYHGKDIVHIEREACPFFSKTGACRFGIHCSREHKYPEVSTTILIQNMYSHFGMEKVAFDEYDDDASLEYSERETYEHFRDFYEDVLPELKRCGSVMQFKVCCNTSAHLRGNLYVQYSNETEALKARSIFNGRWYAGRQLNCILVDISKWKAALCKLFQRNKKGCPKGGQCNFLHAFHNPGNAFWRADMDLPLQGPLQHTRTSPQRSNERGKEKSNRSRKRSRRSRSRSRTRSIRSNSRRSRSRSTDWSERSEFHKLKKKNPSTMTDYRKSRSPSRKSDFRPRKHRRRGRSRSKSKSPSSTKDRSRSPDNYEKLRVKHKSKYSSRNNSRSNSLSKSPKQYRNKSKSPEIFKRSSGRRKTRSPPRKRSNSRSWSPERQGNRSKSPQRSKSKSPYRSNKVNGST
ncbi:U2 small nuclear ribonucleoprotein auxiliary factor 35 kDa subunit-related protein 2-like isoform X2 [Macrobrachium nipponense]|uniref:U2 small nuclear ribonucleoprotein auxiliary factor 35 kDa subunit-related protein 2-like isoform X2 n=1 Tax=Macrobrachium nipponense TaxID=159736 RepID=UPI0030C8157E